MKAADCVVLVVCLPVWLLAVTAFGQTASAPSPATRAEASPSVAACPVGSSAVAGSASAKAGATAAVSAGGSLAPRRLAGGVRPFSAVAIGVRGGSSGLGLELAIPLANRLNVRAGGNFLTISPKFEADGIDVVGDVQLRSGFVSIDLFPFGGGFHISPGYSLYNGNHLSAKTSVPGGQDFDLGDNTYTSDMSDPVHGTFDVSFGKKSAPRLTLGWGNMIPRTGGHWSFPFEIGGEYVRKPPQVTLTLAGSVCQGPGFCQPISGNPTARQNVLSEQDQINSAIPSWLRFYPLISTGVSYRFGHSAAAVR